MQVNNRLTQLRRHWRSLLLPTIVTLYVLFVISYGLMWLFTRDHLWQMDFMSNFTAWYFLPAPILIIAALGLKRRRWVLPLIVILVISIVKYAPRFIPRANNARASDGTIVTVMTMNMLKRNTNWDAVTTQIKAAKADIITIQEIPDAFLQDIWPTLATDYPYNMHIYSQPEESNMGLLSRYPLVEQGTFTLPKTSYLQQLRAVIDVNGQQIVVYNLHLTAPRFQRPANRGRFTGWLFPYEYSSYYRRWEMGFFNEHLETETLPVLVMGDLNTADSSRDYSIFRDLTGLSDTFGEVGFGMGFTFPVEISIKANQVPFVPLMRLDYIWHNAQLQPLTAWLGGSTGSDHLPVIARFNLVEAQS